MKKGVCFLLGAIVGAVLTLFVVLVIADKSGVKGHGMILFDEPGECLSTNRFEVAQVIENDCALAYELIYDTDFGYMTSSLQVLVVNDNGECYSNDQVIKVPKGMGMIQVGVYRYKTKADVWKVIPIVKLMEQ